MPRARGGARRRAPRVPRRPGRLRRRPGRGARPDRAARGATAPSSCSATTTPQRSAAASTGLNSTRTRGDRAGRSAQLGERQRAFLARCRSRCATTTCSSCTRAPRRPSAGSTSPARARRRKACGAANAHATSSAVTCTSSSSTTWARARGRCRSGRWPGTPIPIARHHQWLAIVGSAGQPRDRNNAACYALADLERDAPDLLSRSLRPFVGRAEDPRARACPSASRVRLERGVVDALRPGAGRRDRRLSPGRDAARGQHGVDLSPGRPRRRAAARHEDPAPRPRGTGRQRHQLRAVCRMVLGALAQSRHHPTLVAFGDVETTPVPRDGIRRRQAGSTSGCARRRVAPEEVAALGARSRSRCTTSTGRTSIHLDLKPTNVLYRPERRSGR